MKRISPKNIAIALIVGLALSLGSLLYRKETAKEQCNNPLALCGIDAYKRSYGATVGGFPFTVTTKYRMTSNTEISVVDALGNWAVYSLVVFVVLLFWQPNGKNAKALKR
jgi:hypothetical protein